MLLFALSITLDIILKNINYMLLFPFFGKSYGKKLCAEESIGECSAFIRRWGFIF